jgi:hypothetical protein
MAHVLSVSVEVDGRHYNVPSVRDGEPLTREQIFALAAAAAKDGPGYATGAEADAANKAESQAYGRARAQGDALRRTRKRKASGTSNAN